MNMLQLLSKDLFHVECCEKVKTFCQIEHMSSSILAAATIGLRFTQTVTPVLFLIV